MYTTLFNRSCLILLARYLFLRFRLKIVKERNPVESARPRSASGTRERAAEAGLCITSFDFSPKHPSIFIVGTLCGGIYKCSLDSVTPIEGSYITRFPHKN